MSFALIYHLSCVSLVVLFVTDSVRKFTETRTRRLQVAWLYGRIDIILSCYWHASPHNISARASAVNMIVEVCTLLNIIIFSVYCKCSWNPSFSTRGKQNTSGETKGHA